ncbi:hypothetical protein VTG60DRAFT_5090 [Thermothelomyces hinnuleus]
MACAPTGHQWVISYPRSKVQGQPDSSTLGIPTPKPVSNANAETTLLYRHLSGSDVCDFNIAALSIYFFLGGGCCSQIPNGLCSWFQARSAPLGGSLRLAPLHSWSLLLELLLPLRSYSAVCSCGWAVSYLLGRMTPSWDELRSTISPNDAATPQANPPFILSCMV